MLKKAAKPVKRARAFESDLDEELFELVMAQRAKKVQVEIAEVEEVAGIEPDVEAVEKPKSTGSSTGSSHLGKLLELKKQREMERKRIEIAYLRKHAKGEVFESNEYKKLAEELGAKSEEKAHDKVVIDPFVELTRSKVNEKQLREAKERYFVRVGSVV